MVFSVTTYWRDEDDLSDLTMSEIASGPAGCEQVPAYSSGRGSASGRGYFVVI